MSDVIDKLTEYASSGYPNIWLLDPWHRKAFTFTDRRLQEVTTATISTTAPVIQVSLDELFRGL